MRHHALQLRLRAAAVRFCAQSQRRQNQLELCVSRGGGHRHAARAPQQPLLRRGRQHVEGGRGRAKRPEHLAGGGGVERGAAGQLSPLSQLGEQLVQTRVPRHRHAPRGPRQQGEQGREVRNAHPVGGGDGVAPGRGGQRVVGGERRLQHRVVARVEAGGVLTHQLPRRPQLGDLCDVRHSSASVRSEHNGNLENDNLISKLACYYFN